MAYNQLMKKTCGTCGGSGQIGFFQGVSRFLLTWEECPQCNGTGYIAREVEADEEAPEQVGGEISKTRKKRKINR